MKQDVVLKKREFVVNSGLYVLKHKDMDVAMVQVDTVTGKIEYILDVYLPEELPPGINGNRQSIAKWWSSRAAPDSRRGIQQVLQFLKEETNLSLMLSSYGLSLTDHYWLQPIGEELYWKDLNFYKNDFSDELGNLLTDSQFLIMKLSFSRQSIIFYLSLYWSLLKEYTDMPKERAEALVNFDTQENYIVAGGRKRPYLNEVTFSRDLLEGKRREVLETAVNYYYLQACTVAEGMIAAEMYRDKMKHKRE